MNDAATLLDAVETLSNIAESEVGVGVMEYHSITLRGRQFQYRTVHWISGKGGKEAVKKVRQIFQVIYDYIKDKEKDVEGIRTLMHLVGQAARKLDLAGLMKVQELNEYRKIEEFYNKQIAPKVDQAKLGMWMLALTKNAMKSKKPVKLRGAVQKPLLVDLEDVKADREYELFYLKKEDGTRFYNPRLLRSIRLVCHFGARFYDKRDEEDPFAKVDEWLALEHQVAAKAILSNISIPLSRFYRLSQKKSENELIGSLKKCVMALMLASQTGVKGKGSKGYFADFQRYYREILYSPEYSRLISNPITEKDTIGKCIIDLIQKIALAIYKEINLYQLLFPYVNELIDNAVTRLGSGSDQTNLWNSLSSDYSALSKYARGHVTGSLDKLLLDLQGKENPNFDPWMQHNFPSKLFQIHIGNQDVDCLHIPCPIIQEFVHKAVINEEFKNFLRANEEETGSHLIFNVQDRTSWKEHARCSVLEDLQHLKQFQNKIHVVTFAKTTEFYHQEASYAKEHSAELFKNHLKEHLSDVNTGFYFPQSLSVIAWEDLDPLLDEIHRLFFSQKNVLTREQRLDFIEIAYLCLQIHLLGKLQPASFSFMCKDGVDGGASCAASFYAAVKLFSPYKLTDEVRKMINYILHTPALLNRERVVQPQVFNRFINAVRTIEGVREREGTEMTKMLSKLIKLPVFLA